MRACFLIAERRLFYVKNSASECNENLLSYCLSQSVFYKNNAFSSIRISHNEFFSLSLQLKKIYRTGMRNGRIIRTTCAPSFAPFAIVCAPGTLRVKDTVRWLRDETQNTKKSEYEELIITPGICLVAVCRDDGRKAQRHGTVVGEARVCKRTESRPFHLCVAHVQPCRQFHGRGFVYRFARGLSAPQGCRSPREGTEEAPSVAS